MPEVVWEPMTSDLLRMRIKGGYLYNLTEGHQLVFVPLSEREKDTFDEQPRSSK